MAKRALTIAERKIKEVETVKPLLNGEQPVLDLSQLAKLPAEAKPHIEQVDMDVIFEPNPGPQTDFLAAIEREVLYGGAAGGGKSYAMLADPMRYTHIGAFRGILFRRRNDELRELKFKSKELYPRAFPGARFKEQESTWIFPSGAELWLTYLDRDDDVLRYQGQAFNWIGFDELTQWPSPYAWDYMRSRLRTTHPDLPLFMRASTNPGNVGAWWVRRMFIDAAPWNTSFWAKDIDTDEVLTYPKSHARAGQPLFKRRFIPAKLTDNPYLYSDGEYEANLLAMPEAQRRQLLDGDWDVVEGAAFPEFRRSIHTCDPFPIPSGWTRFRAADWGYSSPACCLWFAIDYDGVLYVYRELYTKKLDAEMFGQRVLEMEDGEPIRYGVLDGSCFAVRGEMGATPGDHMNRMGLRWRKADRSPGSRKSGKLEVHRRLALRDTGLYNPDGTPMQMPGLVIFNTCSNLVRTLPTLPLDKNDIEDVDTDAEDHAYDALRYGCSSRPLNPKQQRQNYYNQAPPPRAADPIFGY